MSTAATDRDDRFTAEQRRAVATRGVSVALSAGAGCGKTFVLTERYLSHFRPNDPEALRPEELGHLVAITFTERAAREMRDRIRAKCYERLMTASAEDAGYWSALLRSLDAARISTIHAFCAALLRSRAIEAGLDPEFGVLEQAQTDTLLLEVIEDEVRRLIARQDATVMALAARFDVHVLNEMLRLIVRSCPADQFAAWREVAPQEQVARWRKFYGEIVVPAVAGDVAGSPAAREVLSLLAEHEPSNATMQSRRRVLLEKLAALAEGPGDEAKLVLDLKEIESCARVQGGGGASAWPSGEVYERFKTAADALRKVVKAARNALGFEPQAALEAAVVGGQMFAIAETVRARYDDRKREANALDFNDLLSRAWSLLADPRHRAMRDRLSSQIHLLLVDEFQDTDPLQVDLVTALCGEGVKAGKLFFVGDYKQSIYRFRGAMPAVFRELREQTPVEGRQSLTLNFRSQPAILDFVNALFWDDLGQGYEPLKAHRPQASPTPAVEFLWAPASSEIKDSTDSLRRREADWVAQRIRQLVDSGMPIVFDPAAAASGGTAPLRAPRLADVAILFRALSDVHLYEEALRHYDVDYYVVGGHAFYAQQEIFDLLNLLRTLARPADLVSLVGALRSGFFSLADETIFWLSRHPQGLAGGLFASEYPAEIPHAERQRARFAAETIHALRQSKDRLRICELVDAALARTGFDAVLLNEFMGDRKLANLRKLVEQARGFQRGDLFDLSDFITQLAEFVVRQPDEPLAATHSENTDVVRLMTVHQSKGLEFPIVFVPDMNRPRYHRAAGVHFDARLGPLVRLPDTEDGSGSLGGYELWRFAERAAEAAELNRLLYVATTRAADYLVLSSGVQELGAASGPWMQLLARRFDLLTGQFQGQLPTGQPRPVVRVTTAEPAIPRTRAARPVRIDLDEIIAQARQAGGASSAAHRAIDAVPPEVRARVQYSFSRLAGTLHSMPPAQSEAPGEIEPSVDPRGLGTLVHSVLAVIDFGGTANVEQIVRLHAQRHLAENSPQIDEAIEMVERFVRSPRARELAAAEESHAEVEFLLAWPPQGTDGPETTLTGFLDRLWRDRSGGWHVLDFKTNRVPRGGIAELAAAYEMQMLVYAWAAEKILKVGPKSLTLHFLRTGAEHRFPWNDAAREKVVGLVNAGIAASMTLPRTYRPPRTDL